MLSKMPSHWLHTTDPLVAREYTVRHTRSQWVRCKNRYADRPNFVGEGQRAQHRSVHRIACPRVPSRAIRNRRDPLSSPSTQPRPAPCYTCVKSKTHRRRRRQDDADGGTGRSAQDWKRIRNHGRQFPPEPDRERTTPVAIPGSLPLTRAMSAPVPAGTSEAGWYHVAAPRPCRGAFCCLKQPRPAE
jgi:hypothetical protein